MRPAIHINLDDEEQVDALFRLEEYIQGHREYLTEDDIRVLREAVHNVVGDAQHDRNRRAEQREPRDSQDWGMS